MGRIAQQVALAIAITATFIGYLYHQPNSAGVSQYDRIRTPSALSKLIDLIVGHNYFL